MVQCFVRDRDTLRMGNYYHPATLRPQPRQRRERGADECSSLHWRTYEIVTIADNPGELMQNVVHRGPPAPNWNERGYGHKNPDDYRQIRYGEPDRKRGCAQCYLRPLWLNALHNALM